MHCINATILLGFRAAIVSRGTTYMPRSLFLLMESAMHIICAEATEFTVCNANLVQMAVKSTMPRKKASKNAHRVFSVCH